MIPVELKCRLQKGDKIRVRPGEKVRVDAVILDGDSSTDESLITGDSVIGGSVKEPTHIGSDFMLSQIVGLDLLKKPRLQKYIQCLIQDYQFNDSRVKAKIE
uniref:P-type ATPase A domain-containing protein n=1 Tax=Amphimedon queenslandica TaxID=400682 RepID=A0A1X7US52_AMPQE